MKRPARDRRSGTAVRASRRAVLNSQRVLLGWSGSRSRFAARTHPWSFQSSVDSSLTSPAMKQFFESTRRYPRVPSTSPPGPRRSHAAIAVQATPSAPRDRLAQRGGRRSRRAGRSATDRDQHRIRWAWMPLRAAPRRLRRPMAAARRTVARRRCRFGVAAGATGRVSVACWIAAAAASPVWYRELLVLLAFELAPRLTGRGVTRSRRLWSASSVASGTLNARVGHADLRPPVPRARRPCSSAATLQTLRPLCPQGRRCSSSPPFGSLWLVAADRPLRLTPGQSRRLPLSGETVQVSSTATDGSRTTRRGTASTRGASRGSGRSRLGIPPDVAGRRILVRATTSPLVAGSMTIPDGCRSRPRGRCRHRGGAYVTLCAT